jgi:hypothetical protein
MKTKAELKTYDMNQRRARMRHELLGNANIGLGAPYDAASDGYSFKVSTPDSMSFEIHSAIDAMMEKIGNIDDYVGTRLRYRSLNELYAALAAEQIDGVALAIYNIENKRQGVVIADQTGIGKGRIAAAMIRYAHIHKKTPIFITQQPSLFSSMYRDLYDIGSADLRPFIVNAQEEKTDIYLDENMIYQAPSQAEQLEAFDSGEMPAGYQVCMLTYSQISANPSTKRSSKAGVQIADLKKSFLLSVAQDSIMILDESHNAAGKSKTGEVVSSMVKVSSGVLFLSATFAKRADNMPLYSLKTCMKEANLNDDAITIAMEKGGVALQEVVAAALVSQGQLIRRERTFEGIEVEYLYSKNVAQQRFKSDQITEIFRLIIKFQQDFVLEVIENLDKLERVRNGSVKITRGTESAGLDAQPFVSKTFNSIKQLLFCVNIDDVVDQAEKDLKNGKAVVIAFSSTMESFLTNLMNDDPSVGIGSEIYADFSVVLRKALDGVMRFTALDDSGKTTYKASILESDLSGDGVDFYRMIVDKINRTSYDMVISPIDYITQKLEQKGYRVGEVTGRNNQLILNFDSKGPKGRWKGIIEKRKKETVNKLFTQFNNNELDVLLINQAGSTGESAHAVVTKKVPRNKVRQRVMLIAEAELDINKEVQKRGRTNRTGQVELPIYRYPISAVPAAKRFAMMLQKKLKSLDANTSSNQKASEALIKNDDFLNKYGDKIVLEYMAENMDFTTSVGNPADLIFDKESGEADIKKNKAKDGLASKVAGRVAILTSAEQEIFYDEITRRYNNYVNYLKESDEYDLEVEVIDLQAEIIDREPIILNDNRGVSPFSDHTYMETCEVKVVKKPFNFEEVKDRVADALKGRTAQEYTEAFVSEMQTVIDARVRELIDAEQSKIDKKMRGIKTEVKYKALESEAERREYALEREDQLLELLAGKIAQINRRYNGDKAMLKMYASYFFPGNDLNIPADEIGTSVSMGISQGFIFGSNKLNKFAPSNISVRIMLANSKKLITLDLTNSNQVIIDGIIVKSTPRTSGLDSLESRYKNAIVTASQNRNTRSIVTGNLLQFFGSEIKPKGKLIQFTTKTGQVRKGALMPEGYGAVSSSGKDVEVKIKVPVHRILKLIAGQSFSEFIEMTDGMTIKYKYNEDAYSVRLSRSRKIGGSIFLNPDLLKYVVGREFKSTGDNKMEALVRQENIEPFLLILGQDIGITANITKAQFDTIKGTIADKQIEQINKSSDIRTRKPRPTMPKGDKVIQKTPPPTIYKKGEEPKAAMPTKAPAKPRNRSTKVQPSNNQEKINQLLKMQKQKIMILALSYKYLKK